MYTIAVLVGSLRRESINLRLAKTLEKLGKDLFTFNFIPLYDVPMFNQDIEGAPGEGVVYLRKTIQEADAVLFVTPEYNRSLPAVMKNAIDWASRPYGKFSLIGKPGATIGLSGGAIGTACAQQELRRILVMLTVRVMGQPEMYLSGEDTVTKEATPKDERTAEFLVSFLKKFSAWIELQKKD